MSKKMTLSNRINTVLVLLAIFLLILGTNRIDQRHFATVQNAITSVFNDRVLAQDYIYKLNNLIHRKEQLLIEGSQTANESLNKEIETLITLFSETELTGNEAKTFNNFKSDFNDLKTKETKYFNTFKTQTKSEVTKRLTLNTPFNDTLEALKIDLNNLSLIQVSESRTITANAQKSLNTNKLMSSMEIYFLLVIGIIILAVTFYRIEKSQGGSKLK